MSSTSAFFAGKRPWSLIKDKVLDDYMQPYLAKVNRRREQILLVDGYAGPGEFEDGTIGSPLIMCRHAERYAPGKYHAVFVNMKLAHHLRLSQALQNRGWQGPVTPIHGDARKLIERLPANVGNQTLFLYLDPFGLRGCEFSLLQPFLNRLGSASTELLFLIHMPVVHRLATRQKHHAGKDNDPLVAAFHDRLTQVFGGEYWKDILWNPSASSEERERDLIDAYSARLRRYLPHVHYCPVQETRVSRVKYYIVFASRHEDALLLMNDIMAKAYHGHMHRQRHEGTLWESSDWRDMREVNDFLGGLDDVILAAVQQHTRQSALAVWRAVVDTNFMQFTRKEFNEALKRLEQAKRLRRHPDPQSRRINENSLIEFLG